LRALGWARQGGLGQVAEGEQGSEEGGPDLRAEAGGDGEEALQRGFLCF